MFAESDLLALAGPTVFGRGLGYVELVVDLRRKGDSAVSTIDGPRLYHVHLKWTRHRVDGRCSCPHNAEGNFCKHLVAVGLAVLADSGEGPATEVVDANSPPDVKTLIERVNAAMPRGHIDYYHAFLASRPVHAMLDTLERLIHADRAAEVRPALERALVRLPKVLARTDDSEGEFGWALQRAVELHAQACCAEPPEPRKLGRWLARYRADSGGTPEITLDMYAPALGAAGIAAYRAAVKKLATDRDGSEYSPLARMLLELADLDGDVDEAVRVLAGGETVSYAAIVHRLLAVDRHVEAMAWLDRAVAAGKLAREAAPRNDFWLSVAEAAELYLSAGRDDDALAVVRTAFQDDPDPERLRQLLDVADRLSIGESERAEAIRVVEDYAARSQEGAARLVLIALDGNDLVAAWSAVERFGVGRAWRALAEASANDLPVAAADLYRPELDRLLSYANTQSYPDVAKILVTMRRLYARVDEQATIDAFIAELREKYRRRPSLMAALDRARLP